MGIELGLSRISTLLSKLGNPQLTSNYIHVAGTNGKGSVCAYLSSILSTSTDFKIGRFTSPHLIYKYDSVTLNNRPVAKDIFYQVENEIISINKRYDIGATEFEILTATAFKIFNLENVDIAVMEVGLGGREDSTNVIIPAEFNKEGKIVKKGVLATGITKIGMDHENILGSTLVEIAYQKAGIIKPNTVNVIDGTNEQDVLSLVSEISGKLGSENHEINPSSKDINTSFGTINLFESPLKGDYQLQNISLALKIVDLITPGLVRTYPSQTHISHQSILKGVQSTSWPGRLQTVQYKDKEILLDGAHNGSAAIELKKYIDSTYNDEPITFILAVTKGKDLAPLLSQLIKPQDNIIVTNFGIVDGMPWIEANSTDDLARECGKYTGNVSINESIEDILNNVKEKNVIVCGSLYLVGEVLRLIKEY
ncbi:hypothetical protein WICPIJ_009499 [Wickerhamomyces pijperi]|uniref:Dihydrofolate synthetase n=1 Tax=Wickerhamomyces pijperi TaxID=599730 RepID=A0A9P8PME2_WICPI|nr:hypothetical protein WICPIJ_009499 [Wickerhamomyces pijperi]